MTSRVSLIGIILFVIFLTPATILMVLELSSLRQNEAVLKEIYTDQLETILFSVNNYSQDLADSWAGRLDKIEEAEGEQQDSLSWQFLQQSGAVLWYFTAAEEQINLYGKVKGREEQLRQKITAFQAQQQDTIKRLKGYLNSGFRKLEAFPNTDIDSLPLVLFYIPRPQEAPLLCGLLLDPKLYVRRVLAPKMQEVARQKVIVFIYDQVKDEIVYSTEDITEPQLPQYKSLWQIPSLQLGIFLKGPSLEALAERRSYTNLFMIIGMNLVLLLGIIWVIRNVRKELYLAQKKSDFVSNVSHEIRTPLALIKMFAETLMLGRAKNEAKKQEYYQIIDQEAARLTRTVNKILNFSKMEANKRIYHMEQLDLAQLVKEILYSYDFHLTQVGFTYEFHSPELPVYIQGDREAVSEAFINLIDNAINYSESDKSLRIGLEQKAAQVILSVADQGIGIAEEEQRAIFGKFYRVSSATIHNTKGTGLGLSLVKHIMDAHQGEIKLRSKLGQGSRFELVFPVGSEQ